MVGKHTPTRKRQDSKFCTWKAHRFIREHTVDGEILRCDDCGRVWGDEQTPTSVDAQTADPFAA